MSLLRNIGSAWLALAFIRAGISFSQTAAATTAPAQHRSASILVEQARLDWDHSGRATTFSLFRTPKNGNDEPDELIIAQPGKSRWKLTNRDDVWASLSETNEPIFHKQTKRLLFVFAGSQPDARVYLVLKGADSGCCDGSMTILTPGDDGKPKVIFHATSYLLTAIEPTSEGIVRIIGKSSSSEARDPNAQSYDPYRIYLLQGSQAAAYNLDLSKSYTKSHYCGWHGPIYDERFVAVGPSNGSTHCRVMAEKEFDLYSQKHPELFPKP